MTRKTRIAIAGLGFGAEFIPIYQAHPAVELVALCQRTESKLEKVADHFGIAGRYTSFEAMVEDPSIDAIHINTPIPDHASQSVLALRAGKHVACTVPMASTLNDCVAIAQAAEDSGKNYMMMETVVYSREFLYVQHLRDEGLLGRIQFMRGSHFQNMAGWPSYWEGLPPMHYATHAVSPVLALLGKPAASVTCVGSGRISDELMARYGSPFAVESALVDVVDSDVKAEVSRALFATSHEYVESFDVFGSKASFRWAATEAGAHVLHVDDVPQPVEVPDFAAMLPEEIRPFTTSGVYSEENEHLSFIQGSGHGGSHPHLAHEFVSSIAEGRPARIDHLVAANWTSVGLLAHESASRGGEKIHIPAI
ncbi:Gfo/Idh/MocA family oxidoreductase [Acrocarpospora macrocephala]|uniref:Oxidoreductase n=1 Tax=Acrocarpospora macrocephala TaxID=150177 RepID=A0A5M3WRG8_9ACTN|nr:Gfo/Idh/MocA family oxidoreductase [Acrocarpospora macrocephala]GES11096.1 oxidoreductase [Acrocarpospora macrocephala]